MIITICLLFLATDHINFYACLAQLAGCRAQRPLKFAPCITSQLIANA
jgi:hypothetical protein